MIINTDLVYQKKRFSNIEELDKESQKVLQWIGDRKVVLELGCHTGNLSEWLTKQECSVVGVDLNENALAEAKPYLHEAVHADLETSLFWDHLENKTFDAITCMHILEHLTNPWETLNKLGTLLNDNGEIIIALPNINNAEDRFKMLFGNFNYTKEGVMDKTHLRFFNYTTARELIESSGLKIVDYYSPWQVNPIYCFIDHIPVIFRLKKMISKSKVPFWFKKRSNLTDVVMVFRCRLDK